MTTWFRHHPVVGGAAAGLAWGLAMRGWMRFISTHPEFTWAGTGFIVGSSATVGAMLGLAFLRREAGGRGWWRLSGLSVLLLGVGAGGVMIPSVLLGAIAFGRTRWAPAVRALFAVLAVAVQATFFLEAEERLPPARAFPALVAYAGLITFEAWAVSIVFRPSSEGAPAPGRAATVVLSGTLTLLAAAVGIVTGLLPLPS
jgi:hypothetical protein